MRRLFALSALLVFAACRTVVRTSPDTLYLASGEELTGTIEKITADSVWFKTPSERLVLSRSEVNSIDLPRSRPGEGWKTVKDITDPVLRKILAEFEPPETDVKYINVYVEHDFILREDGSMEKRTRVIRYISAESGKGEAANNTWSYLADRAYANLDFARSVSPEGKVTHISEAAINRVSLYPAPAEYSNMMQIQAAVPESRVGSILDFQFSTVQNVVDSVHPVYEEVVFADPNPTLVEVVRLEQPEGGKGGEGGKEDEGGKEGEGGEGGSLAFYTNLETQPERTLKAGNEILIWTIQNQPPLRSERMRPPAEDYLPRFIVARKEDWYTISARLKGPVQEATAPGKGDEEGEEGFKEKVDSLTANLDSSEAKARALYRFVATSIRPAGPSLDDYSCVPTPAETVLARRFANNLDRAALLYALMREAGLDADLVLVRTRGAGRLVPTFPALGQLNYALVLFEDRVWLDPRPNLPFGTLLEQDAMGLSLSSGKLKKTPLYSPAEEATLTTSNAELGTDGSLVLDIQVNVRGKDSYYWKRYLVDLSPDELRQEAEQLAVQVHPNAKLERFRFSGYKELDDDVSYTLRLRVPGYAISAGDYLIFYLPGVEHSAYFVGAPERTYPIDRTDRSSSVLNLKVDLPAGAELLYYPQDVSASTRYDAYSAAFMQPRGGMLQFTENASVLEPWIPAADWPSYKSLVEAMARLSQEPIVLKLR